MKKSNGLLLLVIVLVFSFTSYAQSIDGIQIKDLKTNYIEIRGFSSSLSSDMNIWISYGQKKPFKGFLPKIKNEENEKVRFKSMIDAMNFFDKYGWEFMHAYTDGGGAGAVSYYWILKRKKK